MNDFIKQLFEHLKETGYFNTDWLDTLGWVAYLIFWGVIVWHGA